MALKAAAVAVLEESQIMTKKKETAEAALAIARYEGLQKRRAEELHRVKLAAAIAENDEAALKLQQEHESTRKRSSSRTQKRIENKKILKERKEAARIAREEADKRILELAAARAAQIEEEKRIAHEERLVWAEELKMREESAAKIRVQNEEYMKITTNARLKRKLEAKKAKQAKKERIARAREALERANKRKMELEAKMLSGAIEDNSSPIAQEMEEEGTEFVLEDLQKIDEHIAKIGRVINAGEKKWNRGKVMLVGEGGSGKTAFANCILGKPFTQTAPTVGIEEHQCDVCFTSEGTRWVDCGKPKKELEAAVACMLQEAATESIISQGGKQQVNGIEKVADFMVDQYEGFSQDDTTIAMLTSSVPENLKASANGVDVDEDEVLNCLEAKAGVATKLVVSIFDHGKLLNCTVVRCNNRTGGQSIFSAIHDIFLSRNGVYIVIFNMQWLLVDDEKVRFGYFDYILKWIRSIFVRTYSSVEQDTAPNSLRGHKKRNRFRSRRLKGSTAPIFLVGTHADAVPNLSDHEFISRMLFEELHKTAAWPSIIENKRGQDTRGCATMTFYPVDSTRGSDQDSVKHLLEDIEKEVEKSTYANLSVPLSWLKVLDELQAEKRCYLSFEEVALIASECDVSPPEVPSLLMFLNDMGMLLWHNEPMLRDIVVLNAVNTLVEPISRLMCKHIPCSDVSMRPAMQAHTECAKLYPRDWNRFMKKAVLSDEVLSELWQEYAEWKPALVILMVKFGLLLPLFDDIDKDDRDESVPTGNEIDKLYLVPSLLPHSSKSNENILGSEWSLEPTIMSCLLVFTTSRDMIHRNSLLVEDLHMDGFLPDGLFARLICAAAAWCRSIRGSNFDLSIVNLYQDAVVMPYARLKFRLIVLPSLNSIRLDIEGRYPLGVHDSLLYHIDNILQLYLKELKCISMIFYDGCDQQTTDRNLLNDKAVLIQIKELQRVHDTQSDLILNSCRSLSDLEIRRCYGQWIRSNCRRSKYDVFISYRWNEYDTDLVLALYDKFAQFSVGEYIERAVEVFLDQKRLKDGARFDKEFVIALISSEVALPIISATALARMCVHDPGRVDNVLLEWVVMIVCEGSESSRLKAVIPVLIGNRVVTKDATPKLKISNLFAESEYWNLPDTVPVATLAAAEQLLEDTGITFPDTLRSVTVANIISLLLKFMGVLSWNMAPSMVVSEATKRVVKVLRDNNRSSTFEMQQPSSPTRQTEAVDSNMFSMSMTLPSSAFQDTGPNFSRAWAMIEDGSAAKDPEELLQWLKDKGVDDVESLEWLMTKTKSSFKNQVIDMLKDVKKAIFLHHIGD